MDRFDDRIDDQSRRAFVKKAAYLAPAILTLKAMPAFASQGSGESGLPSTTGAITDPANVESESASDPQRRWWWAFE